MPDDRDRRDQSRDDGEQHDSNTASRPGSSAAARSRCAADRHAAPVSQKNASSVERAGVVRRDEARRAVQPAGRDR